MLYLLYNPCLFLYFDNWPSTWNFASYFQVSECRGLSTLKRVNVQIHNLCKDHHIWRAYNCRSVRGLNFRNLNRYFQFAVNLRRLYINAISCSDLKLLVQVNWSWNSCAHKSLYYAHKRWFVAALSPLKQLKGLDVSGFHLGELFFVLLSNSLAEIISFCAIDTYANYPGVIEQLILNCKKLMSIEVDLSGDRHQVITHHTTTDNFSHNIILYIPYFLMPYPREFYSLPPFARGYGQWVKYEIDLRWY